MMLLSVLLQQGDAADELISVIMAICCTVMMIPVYIAAWRIYTKAGQPGWAVLVPIYNYWVLFEMVGKPGAWVLWGMIPPIFPIIMIITLWELAKSFGKDEGFAIGLILLSPIFLLILGFGNAEYVGPGGAPAAIEEKL